MNYIDIIYFYLLLQFSNILHRNQASGMDHLRFYFVTWNVATKYPETKLHSLLNLNEDQSKDSSHYDFYVIGLQEVKAQPQNILVDGLFDDPWTNEIKSVLQLRDYVKAKSIRLQGIILSLFCLRKHLAYLRDIEATYTRTGFNGMWGNKGAVSIRFSIYGCSICLVNSHLSAHDHLLQERIDDYNNIIQQQEFHIAETSNILFHDYVFWLGDLNFRLNNESLTASDIAFKIDRREFGSLLEFDQLKIVRESGDAFSELTENLPTFPPTYKYEIGTNDYDLKRRPSWCDRILYKVTPNSYEHVTLNIEQLSYKSHLQYTLSDHKPVTSDFNIKMIPHFLSRDKRESEQIDSENKFQVFENFTEKEVIFNQIPVWYLNEINTATFKVSLDMEPTSSDWIGLFRDGFSNLENYLSYVYVLKSASPVLPSRNRRPTSSQLHSVYSVQFPGTALRSPGMYRLVYFGQPYTNVISVLGVSEAFHMQIRESDIFDVVSE